MMHSEVMKVTPEMAREWLERNIENNRRVSRDRVNMYARDMLAGNWSLTHQGIAFNARGELIDGQHRLRAVALAGVPVEMMVTHDVASGGGELLKIDMGQARSAQQILRISGEDDALVYAAMPMVKRFLAYKFMRKNAVSVDMLRDYIKAHDSAIEFVATAYGQHKAGGSNKKAQPVVAAAALSAVYAGENRDAVEKFAQVWIFNDTLGCSGYGVKACLDTREKFARGKMSAEMFELLENAIRCFAEHKSIVRKAADCYKLGSEFAI